MPTSQNSAIVDSASVGEPPKTIGKKSEIIKFTIHDFGERKEKPNEAIISPILRAHGYRWYISVHPRGFSCYLSLDKTHIAVTASYDICCKCGGYEERRSITKHTFKSKGSHRSWGFPEFCRRDDFLQYLKDGSVVIECDIRIAEEDRRVWYPEELKTQRILVNLYQDASSKTSDAVFSVGDATYRAHKIILSLQCKKLYEIVEDSSDDITPIQIHSVRKQIFKSLLDFIYTVNIPELDKEEDAIDLLVAADLYDCVDLKLFAESVLVEKFLKAENTAALFLFADSHSCALLKEAATNMILDKPNAVKKTQDWPKVEESHRLLKELFNAALYYPNNRIHNHTPTDDTDRMDVTSIRQELQQANLEVDGSREVLVDRWKTLQSQTMLTTN